MKKVIDIFIEGLPKHKKQSKGDTESPARWGDVIRATTKNLPKIKSKCRMEVVFYYRPDQAPAD